MGSRRTAQTASLHSAGRDSLERVHSLKAGRSIVTLKMMSVNLFDRVPRHAPKGGCVFEGHPL